MGKKKAAAAGTQIKDVFEGADAKTIEAFNKALEEAVKRAAEVGARTGAEVGARSVLDAVEEEKRRWQSENFNRRFANTRLLLQHYRTLNEYYSKVVWEAEDEDEEDEDELKEIMEMMMNRRCSEKVIVNGIKQSSEKTRIIMRHVNKMLEAYKDMCAKSRYAADKRKWRVICGLYLDDERLSAQDIAEREHIHRRTVYKDVDAAVEDLTVLMFGIDGIEKLGS